MNKIIISKILDDKYDINIISYYKNNNKYKIKGLIKKK